MRLKYLKRQNYFKYKGIIDYCSFYLDEDRKITRLWDGNFVTGIFTPYEQIEKITKEEAYTLAFKTRKSYSITQKV